MIKELPINGMRDAERISGILGIDFYDLQHGSRKDPLPMARQITSFVMSKLGYRYQDIADVLGYADHTTIVYNITMVNYHWTTLANSVLNKMNDDNSTC